MNMIHHWLCQSPGWRKAIKTLVPWAMEGLTLGRDVLEIGPGFGVTTDLIRPAVENLTCVEIDSELAQSLRGRMTGEGVKVLCENATSMSIESASFDAVVCFTMLHHVPSPLMQDRFLARSLVFCGLAEFSWELTAFIAGYSECYIYSTRWWWRHHRHIRTDSEPQDSLVWMSMLAGQLSDSAHAKPP